MLTRDNRLSLKVNPSRRLFIESDYWPEQVKQVLTELGLKTKIAPFPVVWNAIHCLRLSPGKQLSSWSQLMFMSKEANFQYALNVPGFFGREPIFEIWTKK